MHSALIYDANKVIILLENWEPRDIVLADFISNIALDTTKLGLVFIFDVGDIKKIVPHVVLKLDMLAEPF
jgi:hypothetical protein